MLQHLARPCFAVLFMSAALSVHAENDALLEACNAVPDPARRLECFRQATGKAAAAKVESHTALRDSLIALDGQIEQGISLNNYSQALLPPAKEFALFERGNPNAKPEAISALRSALAAYNDASRFWRASIETGVKNRGIFTTSTMSEDDMRARGVADLVGKYGFQGVPTGPFGLARGVTQSNGLTTMWEFARKSHEKAFLILDGKWTPPQIDRVPETDDGKPAMPTKACAEDVIDRLRLAGHSEFDIKRTCGAAPATPSSQ